MILALADEALKTETKEKMANKLHALERREISIGKPVFPVVAWALEEDQEPDYCEFSSPDS